MGNRLDTVTLVEPAAFDRLPVLSPEAMAQQLRLERARSDRSGREFALVVLEITDRSGVSAALDELEGHVRCTDLLGRLDGSRIAALLTETGRAGGEVTAARFALALSALGIASKHTVWVYPSRWFGPPSPPPEETNEPTEHDNDASGSGDDAEPALAGVNGLERSFARALPGWKRAMDIVGAGVALVLLSPVMLAAVAAVRLSSPGPVIFRQERAGLGGRPFWMFKFRTMVNGAEKEIERLRPLSEQDGPAFKLTNDPRITPVGRWLRKTSVDELPQLVNVLRGEMSLVGPRPLPCREADGCQQWHRERLDVTPGITCIWQVNGRSNTNFDRWVRMDLAYARRRTPWTDLKLIFLTVPAVLLQRGAK